MVVEHTLNSSTQEAEAVEFPSLRLARRATQKPSLKKSKKQNKQKPTALKDFFLQVNQMPSIYLNAICFI